jgi:hypothetical protein
MIRLVFNCVGKNLAIAAVAMGVAVTMNVPARAAGLFTVKISEKELKLKNPNDAAWDAWFQGDIGFQRMVERNSPFIEIANTSPVVLDNGNNITAFHLSIANEKDTCIPSVTCTATDGNRFIFAPVQGSSFAVLGRTSPSGVSISSSSFDAAHDELIVNLGGAGLAPGALFRFKINLDVDSSFAAQYAALFGDSQPDFRTVLFDINGLNVYDNNLQQVSSADNAKAWVVLKSGATTENDKLVFEDAVLDPVAAKFYNSNLRSSCCCQSDPVEIFEPGGQPVPEPGSACLAIVAVAGGLFFSRRTRNSASAA